MTRALLTVVVSSLVGLSLAAPAHAQLVPAVRPTQVEALARVAKLHAAMTEVTSLVRRTQQLHRNAAGDGEVIALDTSSKSAFKTACAGGGSMSGTYSASTSSTAGSGSVSYTVAFTDCAPGGSAGGDSLSGDVSYTFTTSGTSDGSTTTAFNYVQGTLTIKGANAGKYEPHGLVVTVTAPPKPDGGAAPAPTTSFAGAVTIDTFPITFAHARP